MKNSVIDMAVAGAVSRPETRNTKRPSSLSMAWMAGMAPSFTPPRRFARRATYERYNTFISGSKYEDLRERHMAARRRSVRRDKKNEAEPDLGAAGSASAEGFPMNGRKVPRCRHRRVGAIAIGRTASAIGH